MDGWVHVIIVRGCFLRVGEFARKFQTEVVGRWRWIWSLFFKHTRNGMEWNGVMMMVLLDPSTEDGECVVAARWMNE